MSPDPIGKTRVLLVEDSDDDAALIVMALRQAGFELETGRVQDDVELRAVLADGSWDAVVCDHNLPGFGSRDAMRIVRDHDPALPILLVSGTAREAEIVDAMQNGAWSFVSKEQLARLGPTLERGLEDAAQRKRHRDAQARVAELAAIVESSHDAIIGTDREGVITAWNRGSEGLYGWTADEVIGHAAADRLVPADRRGEVPLILERVLRGDTVRAFETERLAKGGTVVQVSLTVSPVVIDGEVVGTASISRDISERKRAEEALRSSEARYRTLLDNLPDALVVFFDEDLRIGLATGRLMDKAGWTPDEVVGRRVDELALGDHRPALESAYRSALAGEARSVELRGTRNPEMTIAYDAVPVYDAAGELQGGMVLGRDITSQRKAADELRAAQALFEEAFENAPVGMAMLNMDGTYIRVNGAFAALVGREADGLVGLRPGDVAHPDDRIAAQRDLDLLLSGGRETVGRRRYLRPDGTIAWGQPRGRVIREADGRARYALEAVPDITAIVEAEHEQARLEAMLNQAQKLEGIGRLAGGIAHDFNNLLAVILNYAEIGRMEGQAEEALTEISRAAQRAADLTNRLLVFSRREVVEPVVVGLNELVEEMRNFLLRTIGEDIELVLELAEPEPFVRCDKTQLEQSLINLAVNARDALPEGGGLRIQTGAVDVRAGDPRELSGLAPGSYAELRVTDDGAGMPPEVLEHAFEPFFTTKDAGKGTGLGLAMVYGIAVAAGGTVRIDSAPGHGTTVRILLPIVERIAAAPDAQDRPVPAAPESHRVLVVEDEEAVRRLIERILSSHGYDVLAAANADEALDVFEREPEIDLLLTDVVMPGMSGTDLAAELTSRRSDLRVVFTTGYTDRPARIPSDASVLRKPFDAAGLLRHLAAA